MQKTTSVREKMSIKRVNQNFQCPFLFALISAIGMILGNLLLVQYWKVVLQNNSIWGRLVSAFAKIELQSLQLSEFLADLQDSSKKH